MSLSHSKSRIIVIVLLTIISLIVYYFFPNLDIIVSELFYDNQYDKFINSGSKLQNFYIYTIREKINYYVLILFVVLGIHHRKHIISLVINFALLCIFSTWLFVNELIKNHIPRSRPRNIVEFGGSNDFSTIWTFMEGNCRTNCSFVSGDVAFAFSLYIIIYFLFYRLNSKIGQKRNRSDYASNTKELYSKIEFYFVSIMIITSSIFVVYMRLSLGAHFLSDTIFGALIGLASIELLLLKAVIIKKFDFIAR